MSARLPNSVTADNALAIPSHALDRLLKPRSIAIVGASPREGSFGNMIERSIASLGFEGQVFLINPKYSEIHGRPAYASLSDLPTAPDCVAMAIADGGIHGWMLSHMCPCDMEAFLSCAPRIVGQGSCLNGRALLHLWAVACLKWPRAVHIRASMVADGMPGVSTGIRTALQRATQKCLLLLPASAIRMT